MVDIFEKHLGKPWFNWPKKPNIYLFAIGEYIPTYEQVQKEYPTYSKVQIERVLKIFKAESKLCDSSQIKNIAQINNDLEFNLIWNDLKKLSPEKKHKELDFTIYSIISKSLKKTKRIIDYVYSANDIDGLIKSSYQLAMFLRSNGETYFENTSINQSYPIDLNSIRSYIDDINSVAKQFHYDGKITLYEPYPGSPKIYNDSNHFQIDMEENLPKLSNILFKLSALLGKSKELNPIVKQQNSKNKFIQAFCRILVFNMRKEFGKPCYKIASIIADFIFRDQFDLFITEDYVKQTCRSKVNTEEIDLELDLSHILKNL